MTYKSERRSKPPAPPAAPVEPESVPEPPVVEVVSTQPRPVVALWAVPQKNVMLVRADDGLYLIDAALWTGERKLSVPPDRLQPAPDWSSKALPPKTVSELMLISGIVDEETLASKTHQSHFFQNLMATYAKSLRETP